MSDLKLFRTTQSDVAELPGDAMALDKSLQTLFEVNVETLLGVRFLASEFVTNEGGQMNTLGTAQTSNLLRDYSLCGR